MDRRILVVDPSDVVCRRLARLLARPGRVVDTARDGTGALERLVERPYDLVLAELHLQGVGGIDLIREVRLRDLSVPVVLMAGEAPVDAAVAAMRLGAYDYLTKPVDPARLDRLTAELLDDRPVRDGAGPGGTDPRSRLAFHNLLGRSAAMREVLDRLVKLAPSPCNVLVTGETGTGKELVAQALHFADTNRRGPFVAVNCAALPESLLASELFGHERGAFTGADRLKKGRFELAGSGTLLLDEIGELPLTTQAKLLRVLQDGSFERAGGSEVLKAECRVIAATNLNLGEAVAAGRFREDLYYRLNVVAVELPPLRDRLDDIPTLASHFLDRLAQRGVAPRTFSPEAMLRLQRYDWPGNVRELEHLVELMAVTSPGPVIEADHLPPHVVSTREAPFSLDYDLGRPLPSITDELTERIERAYIVRVLEKYRGRIDRTAAHCGLSRRSLSEKLRRYQIDKADFKPVGRRVRRREPRPVVNPA